MADLQKIMLIDDDPLIRKFYGDFFRQVGFVVETASDGPTAIESLSISKPDLVLLDLYLPKMNGVEVLKQIRAQEISSDLPVVVFSFSSGSHHIDDAWRAGATKCLCKHDFDPLQLLKVIRTVLSQEKVLSEEKASGKQRLVRTSVSHLPSRAPAVGHSHGSAEERAREKYLEELPGMRRELRDRWQEFINSEDDSSRLPKMLELHRAVQTLGHETESVSLTKILRVCNAFGTFLQELYHNGYRINRSTLRTAADAVDLIMVLTNQPMHQLLEKPASSLILIVDEQINSQELIDPLASPTLAFVCIDDAAVGVKLAQRNRFQVIFWQMDMPPFNAAEVYLELQQCPMNKDTPVVFLTNLDQIEPLTAAQPGGEADLIAKPVLFSELTLKGLTSVVREQLDLPAT